MKWIAMVFFSGLFFISGQLMALVDYTGEAGQITERENARKAPVAAFRKNTVSRPPSSDASPPGATENQLRFDAGVESLSVDSFGTKDKIFRQIAGLFWKTPYSFYLSARYWYASDAGFGEVSDSGRGNPQFKMGFNWFEWGDFARRVSVDLVAGYSFAMINSDWAASRDDVSVAMETSKRFGGFLIGFGYEYIMTGAPKRVEETDPGDIQKFSGGIGWVVSHDISFALQGATVRIGEGDRHGRPGGALKRDLSFAFVSPKLLLMLSKSVEVEMAGIFRVNRSQDRHDLDGVRLLDIEGAQGNSIYASLGITI